MTKLGVWKSICAVVVLCTATAIVSPGQTFTTLHSFDGTDGKAPYGTLIQGLDGNLYGTTYDGGADSGSDMGTAYKITPQGTLTVLHNFCHNTGCPGGDAPFAGLLLGNDGNFYGTAQGAGTYGNGTVFKITSQGTFTTLYNFGLGTDGAVPTGGLAQGTDGNFYGTTSGGGAHSEGTIFKITPGGTLTIIYSFCSLGTFPNCADGFDPYAGLVQGTDGNLYGTTTYGGANSNGTVFKITPAGVLTTLYSFCTQSNCTDGDTPYAGLVQGADGNFYGTASSGGANNFWGTVFKITPQGTLTTLHSFAGAPNDGGSPKASLLKATDGNFYGTTAGGGANFQGTVFKITPQGTLTTLFSFCVQNQCTDGGGSVTGVVEATNGILYGTTLGGGTNQFGTVFSLDVGLGGGGPAVTLSRTSLSFGNQVINTTSAAKSVTVTNTGSATLDISSITTSGDFAIFSDTCGPTLAVGAKCTVKVTFTPTVLGKLTGALTFTDNAPNSPQTVALSGTGVLPATLKPAKATYTAQTVGTTSPPKTFTLTNNQTVTLSSIVLSTTGDFAVSATTCTASLGPKSKCTISVTFTPTAKGTRTGVLSVSDSANNSPQKSSLTGTGT